MYHFIYNPVAGNGKARRAKKIIEEKLLSEHIDHRFHATDGVGSAGRIARALSESGETEIVAIGGDGTLHEVLNGLTHLERVRLGLIPCGSGNDFAATAGIPAEPLAALELILRHPARPTDYIDCSGVRCINALGTGIDVEILRRSYAARFLRGSLNYFVSLLRSLVTFRFYGLTTHIGGAATHHEALIVCACNGRRFGGGIPICPASALDDGKLHYVLVEDIRKGQIPLALVQLMRGRILEQRYTRHEKLDALRITTDAPATLQIDGEFYENLPFDAKIVPGGLMLHRA